MLAPHASFFGICFRPRFVCGHQLLDVGTPASEIHGEVVRAVQVAGGNTFHGAEVTGIGGANPPFMAPRRGLFHAIAAVDEYRAQLPRGLAVARLGESLQ